MIKKMFINKKYLFIAMIFIPINYSIEEKSLNNSAIILEAKKNNLKQDGLFLRIDLLTKFGIIILLIVKNKLIITSQKKNYKKKSIINYSLTHPIIQDNTTIEILKIDNNIISHIAKLIYEDKNQQNMILILYQELFDHKLNDEVNEDANIYKKIYEIDDQVFFNINLIKELRENNKKEIKSFSDNKNLNSKFIQDLFIRNNKNNQIFNTKIKIFLYSFILIYYQQYLKTIPLINNNDKMNKIFIEYIINSFDSYYYDTLELNILNSYRNRPYLITSPLMIIREILDCFLREITNYTSNLENNQMIMEFFPITIDEHKFDTYLQDKIPVTEEKNYNKFLTDVLFICLSFSQDIKFSKDSKKKLNKILNDSYELDMIIRFGLLNSGIDPNYQISSYIYRNLQVIINKIMHLDLVKLKLIGNQDNVISYSDDKIFIDNTKSITLPKCILNNYDKKNNQIILNTRLLFEMFDNIIKKVRVKNFIITAYDFLKLHSFDMPNLLESSYVSDEKIQLYSLID